MYIVTEMWIWKGKGASIKDVPVQGGYIGKGDQS